MGGELSMDARREITRSLAKKYAAAAKKEKGLILDHVTATTGWSRANARRQLVAVVVEEMGLREGRPEDNQSSKAGTEMFVPCR